MLLSRQDAPRKPERIVWSLTLHLMSSPRYTLRLCLSSSAFDDKSAELWTMPLQDSSSCRVPMMRLCLLPSALWRAACIIEVRFRWKLAPWKSWQRQLGNVPHHAINETLSQMYHWWAFVPSWCFYLFSREGPSSWTFHSLWIVGSIFFCSEQSTLYSPGHRFPGSAGAPEGLFYSANNIWSKNKKWRIRDFTNLCETAELHSMSILPRNTKASITLE